MQKKYINKLAVFGLFGVTLLATILGTATAKPIEGEGVTKDDFEEKYIKTDWEIDLWRQCQKTSIFGDKRNIYIILRAQIKAESRGKRYCIEYKERNGKQVPRSYGLSQISIDTVRDYQYHKRLKPAPYWRLKKMAFSHNIEIFTWKTRHLYKKYKCIKTVISMHNWGERGYHQVFRKQYPHLKYWVSVNKTRVFIPKEFKGIL